MKTPQEITCADPPVVAQLEKLVARHGVNGFRLRDVAQAVGQTESVMRARYGSLAGLQAALARRLTGMLALRFCDAEPAIEPTRVSLNNYIARWVDFCAEHPAYVRLCLHQVEIRGGRSGPLRMWEGPLALLHLRLSELIRAGRRRGEVRPVVAGDLLRLISDVLMVELAAAQRRRASLSRSTRRAVMRLICEMAWGYLTTTPAQLGKRAERRERGVLSAQRVARLQCSTRCLGKRVLQ